MGDSREISMKNASASQGRDKWSVWYSHCSVEDMATRTRRLVSALVLIVSLIRAVPTHARDFPRVRAESPVLAEVLAAGMTRSATFRVLVERIEQSDVIVYLMCQRFSTTTLRGRTRFAAAASDARYVRVDIQCYDLFESVASIVAHELQHVVEIASSPQVVDERSLARLYSRIGFRNCVGERGEQFETAAAEHIGDRVRGELRHRSDDRDATVASSEDARAALDVRTSASRASADRRGSPGRRTPRPTP